MEYPSIDCFTYKKLQRLARTWRDFVTPQYAKIKLSSSKQTLYNRLLEAHQLSPIVNSISVYFPSETIEIILSYSEDDMYTSFALTSKYWYDRSRSPVVQWWERRYLQLGYCIPPENTVPMKILFEQVRPKYGDTLIEIYKDKPTYYNVPLSTELLVFDKRPGVRTVNNKEMVLLYEGAKLVHHKKPRRPFILHSINGELWNQKGKSKYQIGLDSKVVKILSVDHLNDIHVVLAVDGTVYWCSTYDYLHNTAKYNLYIDEVDQVSPVRDIVKFRGYVLCLTYDNKVYEIRFGIHSICAEYIYPHRQVL